MIAFLPDDYTPPPSRGAARYRIAVAVVVLAAAAAAVAYIQADVSPLPERARPPEFTASAHAGTPREVSPPVPFHEQYGVRALEAAVHIEAF